MKLGFCVNAFNHIIILKAGQFTKANEATLKGRQIIKAKRRNVGDATVCSAIFYVAVSNKKEKYMYFET